MNNKGLTLIELLVTMVILIVLISAVYLTYVTIYSDYRKETKNIETELEKVVGQDLLRLDITHLGYGISDNETSKLIECINCDDSNPADNQLILRSTFNITKDLTQHWIFINRDDNITINSDNISLTTNRFVYLDKDKNLINDNLSYNNFISSYVSGKFLGFPVEADDNGCLGQLCSKILYNLTNTSLPKRCNSNTFNLNRQVNNDPILMMFNCVADFTIRLDYDSDGNGKIDNSSEKFKKYSDISTELTKDVKKKLKRVSVYMLIQEGSKDKNFTFTGNIVNSSYLLVKDFNGNLTDCVENDVCLKLPSDFQHYRWKVINYSIKPMDL